MKLKNSDSSGLEKLDNKAFSDKKAGKFGFWIVKGWKSWTFFSGKNEMLHNTSVMYSSTTYKSTK